MEKEYCNPLDLEYKYQHYAGNAHREAADPTLVLFKGRYYLFASMSAGFFYSDNLTEWKWHENRKLDMYRYAPDVRQIGDWLYFCASTRKKPSAIWRTRDPLSDGFEKVSEPFAFWDPDLFEDDDGRVYFYWGCGNTEPLWGVELNRETMMPVGEKTACIDHKEDEFGWERFNYPGKKAAGGRGLTGLAMRWLNRKGRPYIEGAFMNKWNGRYYLQYAAPGTEFHVYGDGCYVGSSPLGPFQPMANSPFSLKPSGFITGAGHGSTIEDKDGNLFHAATMRISVNANFERRVGLFPCGLDEDGLLYCCQGFGDYPTVLPEGKYSPKDLKQQYFLLSYKKKAEASSSQDGHPAELALNEDIRTWWAAQTSQAWYLLDLGHSCRPHSVQINFADHKVAEMKVSRSERSDIMTNNRYIDSSAALKTRFVLEGSNDRKNWFTVYDASQSNEDRPHPYIVLDEKFEVRYLRLTVLELPYGKVCALSGFRVFGRGQGSLPSETGGVIVQRDPDGMGCVIRFEPAGNAFGYLVRYGVREDKLYSSWMVYEKTEVHLTTLNKGQKYFFTVDSFNENGVCEGTHIYRV
ncbi:MAG: family 43 glycosylhydrolase [Solobacterium sp.]|nr:family 43 glycosylhydrolase [Solobacterium sp.]